MENVNENVVNNQNSDAKNNVNINSFKDFIFKNASTIAIVLSIISILFSTFALIRVNKHPKRDFRMERPYNTQSEMPNNYFNNDYSGQSNNFNAPNNNFSGQNNNFNGPNGNFGDKDKSFSGPNNNQFYSQRPPMHNGKNFNNKRPRNYQYDYKNYPNNNQNSSSHNNSPNPSTSDNGPKVAPEVSPSK